MHITIRVRLDTALILQQPDTSASKQLLETAKEVGVVLEPVHPGAKDPNLAPYFTIKVLDRAAAERVISRLQHCDAVEAAYIKPPDELP